MNIRLLHVSDLHLKDASASQDLVTDSLLRQVQKLAATNPFDALFISGDLVYSGGESQFVAAKAYVDRLIQVAQCPSDNVFIVPGNHDVSRNVIEEGEKDWWYNFDTEKKVTQTLASSTARPKLLAKLANYQTCAAQVMPGVTVGQFGQYLHRIVLSRAGEECTLRIAGLNSALFAGYDGDDAKHLAIGLAQVDACDCRNGSQQELVVCMFHHPFDCYHECDAPTLHVIKMMSDIILTGHMHKPHNEIVVAGNTTPYVSVSAGASFLTRESQNSFNIIELDSVDSKGLITFYRYHPATHDWAINTDVNLQVPNHALPFTIAKSFAQAEPQAPLGAALTSFRYVITSSQRIEGLNRYWLDALQLALRQTYPGASFEIVRVSSGSIVIELRANMELPDLKAEDLNARLQELISVSDFTIDTIEVQRGEVEKGDMPFTPWSLQLTENAKKYLSDAGASFAHPRCETLRLSDIFVWPDLQVVDADAEKRDSIRKYLEAQELIEGFCTGNEARRAIVFGAVSSGKTSLAKAAFDELFHTGFVPVIVNGEDIKGITDKALTSVVQKAASDQYMSIDLMRVEKDMIVVLIDDFHKLKIKNPKFKVNVLRNLESLFPRLLILGNELMQYGMYATKGDGFKNMFEGYDKYYLAELGPIKRHELIRNWNAAGREELIEPNELIRINNETTAYVDQIMGKNYLPAYPLFLLTVLQAREGGATPTFEYSQHGFYYEKLINDSLSRAVSSKDDISLYYNYITDYAFFLFESKIGLAPVQQESFVVFHKKYCADYDVSVEQGKLLDTFIRGNVLELRGEAVKIRYRYIYYFFVAKHLASHLSEEPKRLMVQAMCNRLHREEFSSITMFLTHLTKDNFVLDEIMTVANGLFKEYEPLKLEDDVKFANDWMRTLPERVYHPISIEDAKQEELREEEDLKRQEAEFDSESDLVEYDLKEDVSNLDAVAKMTQAVKTIDLVGQISKKYWGALKADRKYECAEAVYMLGLRTMGFYISLISSAPDMMVEYLVKHLRKRHREELTKSELEELSKRHLFGLGAVSSYYMVRRITQAIGYEKLENVFAEVKENHPMSSTTLIDVSNRMEIHGRLPFGELEKAKEAMKGNSMAYSVLRNLVMNFLYMFNTDVRDRQKVMAMFDIKMGSQRVIEATSRTQRRKFNRS